MLEAYQWMKRRQAEVSYKRYTYRKRRHYKRRLFNYLQEEDGSTSAIKDEDRKHMRKYNKPSKPLYKSDRDSVIFYIMNKV